MQIYQIWHWIILFVTDGPKSSLDNNRIINDSVKRCIYDFCFQNIILSVPNFSAFILKILKKVWLICYFQLVFVKLLMTLLVVHNQIWFILHFTEVICGTPNFSLPIYSVFQKGCNRLFNKLYLDYFNFFLALKTLVAISPICKDGFLKDFWLITQTHHPDL